MESIRSSEVGSAVDGNAVLEQMEQVLANAAAEALRQADAFDRAVHSSTPPLSDPIWRERLDCLEKRFQTFEQCLQAAVERTDALDADFRQREATLCESGAAGAALRQKLAGWTLPPLQ